MVNISDLLPDTKEFDITRRLLRDVEFHREMGHLTAFCNNNIEKEYIESLVREDIIKFVKKKYREKKVTIDVVKNDTPDGYTTFREGGSVRGTAPLRPDYDFDHFIAGTSNKVALACAIKIARSLPAQKASNNFLYIHGGVGLGKTHLLHATLNDLVKQGKNVVLFNGSQFADYILEAVNGKNVSYIAMMQLFSDCDVLAIDDIGFLNDETMPRVMREFKGILDVLVSGGKTGLFTGSLIPPDESWKLIPEVATRLVTGYVAQVDVPDRQLRRELVENEFLKMGVPMAPNIISYIADANIKDIRTIQEVCHRIGVEYESRADPKSEMDINKVTVVLKEHHITTQPPDEQLVTQALERMNKRLSLDQLKQKDYTPELFRLRNTSIYELVDDQGLAQSTVARAFGMSPQRVNMIIAGMRSKHNAKLVDDTQLRETPVADNDKNLREKIAGDAIDGENASSGKSVNADGGLFAAIAKTSNTRESRK